MVAECHSISADGLGQPAARTLPLQAYAKRHLNFVLGKMTAKNRRPSTHSEFEVEARISKIIERVDNEVNCPFTGWRDNSQSIHNCSE